MKIMLTPLVVAISAAFLVLAPFSAVANPTVTITSVTQNIPWNGKVNIAYKISGERSEGVWQVVFSGTVGGGEPFNLSTFESTPSVDVGEHVAVWNAGADGVLFGTNPFVASVKLNRTDIVYDGEYMVIDVSGGRDALSYPVTFMEAESTASFNVEEFKHGKIVLKKVKAGTFLMGSPEDEEGRNITLYNYSVGGPETEHYVKIFKDFYLGVFPVTIDQFSNVVAFAKEPFGVSKGGNLPIERQSYNNLVDADGFFDVFNKKALFNGVSFAGFDFPTESQWEYACRAGTTSAYYFGETGEDYETYCGKWGGQNGYWAYAVGTYPANPWGFYDLLGTGFEYCQDHIGAYPAGTMEDPAVDPVHGNGSDYVIRRGYSRSIEPGADNIWRHPYFYRSAARNSIGPGAQNGQTGFRLQITRRDLDNYETVATAEGVIFDTDTTKEPLRDATVTLAADEFVYDGTEKKPAMSVMLGGKTLTDGEDYTAAYSDPVNVGVCTVTLTGLGHYLGTKKFAYYILHPQVGAEVQAKASLDFRDGVLEVRTPATLFRIAHNNTPDYLKGGIASDTVKARIEFAPLASEETTPDEGDFMTAVEADGEGTFKWLPPSSGLYLARLQVVDGEAVVSTLTRKLKVVKSGIMVIVR